MIQEIEKPVDVSPLRPRVVEATPPCVTHCPNESDIRRWLTTIAQAEAYGRTDEQALELAWNQITELNPFPAICGRVCPYPCEAHCNRKDKDGPVAINAMERFIGDFGIARRLKLRRLSEEKFHDKIAIVGSGPAGLSCAYQLSRRGYPVTVYEAFSLPGGMLRYGIPEYRLPREILDAEIQKILDLGVDLKCGTLVGKDISLAQLRQEYKAIFVGIGAHKGLRLGVPGGDAPNVMTGIEFLNRTNSGESIQVGTRVVIVGGGDTAIDAARICRRLGAEVTILYRRTRNEMPAIAKEIDGALEEGVAIEFLAAPIEVLQENGHAVGLNCLRMKPGDPDASGRPQPLPIAGSDFTLRASTIIAAVSQEPEFAPVAGLKQNTNWIQTDAWGATGNTGIYAGGDALALALVATAVYQGRLAAQAMEAHLRGEDPRKPPMNAMTRRVISEWYPQMDRQEQPRIPVNQREMDTEIEKGLSTEAALAEAGRCMSCGTCMDCEACWMYCAFNCFVRLPKGEHFKINLDVCNGCRKCAEGCPSGYLELI